MSEPIVQTAVMPLTPLSGVLPPMEPAPGRLYGPSRIDPVAYVVDAERALFAGEWNAVVALGRAVAVAATLLVLLLGSRAMRRISARPRPPPAEKTARCGVCAGERGLTRGWNRDRIVCTLPGRVLKRDRVSTRPG